MITKRNVLSFKKSDFSVTRQEFETVQLWCSFEIHHSKEVTL